MTELGKVGLLFYFQPVEPIYVVTKSDERWALFFISFT